MYLTYTSEIFPDLRRKKQVFVDQYLGLFLVVLGPFCHFVPGLLAIALGPKPSPVTQIAGIGLGTRLGTGACVWIDLSKIKYTSTGFGHMPLEVLWHNILFHSVL